MLWCGAPWVERTLLSPVLEVGFVVRGMQGEGKAKSRSKAKAADRSVRPTRVGRDFLYCLFVVVQQREHIVALQLVTALQEVEFNDEAQADDFRAQ